MDFSRMLDGLSHPGSSSFSAQDSDMSSLLHQAERPPASAAHPGLLWESVSDTKLPPLGRVLNTLLSAKYQELQRCTSQGDAVSQKGSISRALVALLQHADIAVQRGSTLEHLCAPLLEHVVKSRDRSNRKQVVTLMQWLIRNRRVGSAIANSLVRILGSKQCDHHVKLGWCVVVRELLQQRTTTLGSLEAGISDGDLTTFFSGVPDLLNVMSESSVKDMPTRLSIAAADCILLLTKDASEISYSSSEITKKRLIPDQRHQMQPIPETRSRPLPVFCDMDESRSDCHEDSSLASTSGREAIVESEMLLWEQLDSLVKLVSELKKWNEKSRPLHAKGLQQVERRLQSLAHFRDSLQAQGGGKADLLVGAAVLSTCWRRYSLLMLLENSNVSSESKAMLQQWLEGLQRSLQIEETGEEVENIFHSSTRKAEEIRSFFLTCLALLMGRLEARQLENVIQEFGSQLLHVLFGQLRGKHTEVADLAVAILRTFLFQTESANTTIFKMETIAPLLMDLLDERDSTSRAVVVLIADYFAANPCTPELERLFAILSSGSSAQRQNALGVLSELLHTISSSEDSRACTLRQNVARHLLNRLGDVELTNRVAASELFAKLDPAFVLPALVQHIYSRDEKVRSAASGALVSVLKGHSDQSTVLCVLLDCASNMIQKATTPMHPGQIGVTTNARSRDVDRIMRLIPAWASEVNDWDPLIEKALEKTFAEPSNAVMPRFLSQISTHLSDKAHAVFKHIFALMDKQPKMTEELIATLRKGDSWHPHGRLDIVLFERLSPLLVLKVLPLKTFNDLSCQELYGGMTAAANYSGNMEGMLCKEKCITNFLIDRVCGLFEFDDVRKLSAELLGRLVPCVLLPLLTTQLESAIENLDTLKAKACIFAICTSLWLRGKECLLDQAMGHIRSLLVQILLWPCSIADGDTAKTQHGCIDCLAMMISAELTPLAADGSDSEFVPKSISPKSPGSLIEEITGDGVLKRSNGVDPKLEQSVLSSVISCTIGERQSIPFLQDQQWEQVEARMFNNSSKEITEALRMQTAFRLCMANVLISVSQKISVRERQPFVSQMIPPIMKFVQVGTESKMKPACLQVLFTAVYHLKDVIIPYAADLLNLSIGALRSKGSAEERVAAARLMASLLACDDHVTREIAPYLPDATLALASISSMDSSSELRAMCEQLLKCLTPPDSHIHPV